MIDSSFLVSRSRPEGPCHASCGIPLEQVSVQLCRVRNIVEIFYRHEKTCPGFGSITQVMALCQVNKR